MGSKTKIDWCDATWSPVTGCLHGCSYCYASRIAHRFGDVGQEWNTEAGYECDFYEGTGENHELNEPCYREWYNGKTTKAPYPFAFDPTFHRYRLDEPQKWKQPKTIFVCSMADLFGDWVPDEWINEVFAACEAAPQHRYIFLTKNAGRYCDLERAGILRHSDNMWYGVTFDHSNWHDRFRISGRPVTFSLTDSYGRKKPVHDAGDYWFPGWFWKEEADKGRYDGKPCNSFVCFEPLLYDIGETIGCTGGDWLIIGAETGNRCEKIKPKREWVDHIVTYANRTGKPVFMKESLRDLMGDDFRQEFPWK